MSVRAVHLIAHGRVQGVGFRFFVRGHAVSSGVRGWVRNLPDGTVEMYGEAEEAVLRDFIRKIKQGPMFGSVSELSQDWIEPEGDHQHFDIVY